MSQYLELERRSQGDALGEPLTADSAESRPGRDSREAAPVPEVEEHLASLLSPYSFEADQYRLLRQSVEQLAAKERKVIAITSPAAGDGKTTTAINLAATLAQSSRSRVLLVDTDLRRPFVAANLGLDMDAPGLADAVRDEQIDLAAVVQATPYNLAVVPAGAAPADAYRVLESARVGQLLDTARGSYDCVILDMPPVLLVPDCRLMSQWIDGFLLVVAAHRTPRKLLGEALSAMDEAKVLGIVFNGDDRPLSGYYGGDYRSYYHHPSAPRRGGWWRSWRGQAKTKRGQKARPQPWR